MVMLAPTPTRRGGYTLIEMLVILAILATLLGVSVSVFSRIGVGYELPAAKSQVSSILRAARNYSRSSGLPSRVLIESGSDIERVTAFGYELVAAYHFEDAETELSDAEGPPRVAEGSQLRGALNERGELVGEVYSIQGKLGSALEFVNDGAAVVADYRPRYYSTRGFSLEAWVRFDQPELSPQDQREIERRSKRSNKGGWVDPRREQLFAVISLIGSYEIGVLGDGGVYVMFGDVYDDVEDDNEYFCVTREAEVVAGRWTHLRATYDGLELQLEVDGIEREWWPEGLYTAHPDDWPPLPREIPRARGELTISRPDRFFLGAIDEPKIRVALPPRTFELSNQVRFLTGSTTIYFDTRGSLDPIRHSNPIVVRMTDAPPVETEPARGTAVLPRANTEGDEEGEKASEEDEEVTDVLTALAQYLEEQGENADPELLKSVEQYMDKEEVEGRTETIVVDLTGTIRG